jgi:hypothetical protein
MAIGQSRTIGEGLASVKKKIMQNPFQFFLAALLVVACGATKKVRAMRARRHVRIPAALRRCHQVKVERISLYAPEAARFVRRGKRGRICSRHSQPPGRA